MDKINSTLIYAIIISYVYFQVEIILQVAQIAYHFYAHEKILVNLSNRPLDKFMRLICVL